MKTQLAIVALLSFQMSYGMDKSHDGMEKTPKMLFGSEIDFYSKPEEIPNFFIFYRVRLKNGEVIVVSQRYNESKSRNDFKYSRTFGGGHKLPPFERIDAAGVFARVQNFYGYFAPASIDDNI